MGVEIRNYKESMLDPKVKAVFDVYIPGLQLTLRRFKLMVTKNDKIFLCFPSYSEPGADGAPKWEKYYFFSQEKGKEFVSAVFLALKSVASIALQELLAEKTQESVA